MSILGMFDIGRTALFTTRKALDTTAHNIANASTPGYSRQDVVLENVPMGDVTSIGSSGRGVQLKEVKRMYDSFISLQLRTEKSNLSYWDAYDKSATKIENIFNEASGSGIAPAITDFFNAWQEVSQNPDSYAQRSLLLKKAEYLTSRINTAYSSIDNERVDLLKGSQSLVNEVNSLAATISDMNDKLAAAPGSLDLLDQRDSAIERLNQILKVNSFENNNGAITILIDGTPLVDAGQSYTMSATADADNYMHISVNFSGSDKDITSGITGGELKANLDLRDTKIPEIKNSLNEFSFYLSETVNYYHKQGYGLDGSTGNDFFKSLFSVEDLSGGGTLSSLDVTDTTKLDYNKQYKIDYIDTAAFTALTDPDDIAAYQKEEVGANDLYWRVQESTDGTTWTTVDPSSVTLSTNTASGVHYRKFEFSGLNIKIDGYQGALLNNSSETFTVMSNQDAARDMALLITDTQKIAASVDSFSVDTSNNQVVFNIGGANMTATLAPGLYTADELASSLQSQMQTAVQTAYGIAGTDFFSVTYDPNNKQFKIINNSSITASQGIASQNDNTLVGGTTFSFSLGDGAVQTITGTAAMTLEDFRDAINAKYSGVTAVIYNDGSPMNPYRLVLTANSGSAVTITANDTNINLANKKVESGYRYTDNTSVETITSNAGNNYTGTTNKTFLVQIATAGVTGVATYKYSIDGGTSWLGSGGVAYDSTKADDTAGGAITTVDDFTNKWIDGSAAANTTNENVKVQFSAGALSAGDKFSVDVFSPDMQTNILWTESGTTAEDLFGFTSDSSFSVGGSDTSDTDVSAQASHGLPGDNKNSKAIADLVNQMIIAGKTPTDYYRGIVSDAGVDSQAAKRNLTFQVTIVAELESRRQQVSGVSLDEEASNLIMYQKSYEAAAKMISLADELMTALLGMIAR